MTRLSTSRPTSSVPNQCASEGALRTLAQLCAVGSYGETTAASNASKMNSKMTSSPKMAALRLHKLRSARALGLSVFPGRAAASRSASCVAASMRSGSQPRIDQNVRNVGKEIERDIDRRRHQDDTLDDGIITVEHGIDNQLAETRNVENLLGQHRAGKKRSEFERAERDDRGERVAHGMLEDDRALHQSLGAGGAHIIALQHGEHGAARMAHEDRRDRVAEHEGRHDRRCQ